MDLIRANTQGEDMVMGGVRGAMDDGMGMMAPPPSPSMPGGGGGGGMPHMNGGGGGMKMMHMTFFWGSNVQILFSGFPGDRGIGIYILALILVLVFSALIEFLSALSRRLSPSPTTTGGRRASNGLLLTGIHALLTGLHYLIMLAVMSFNVGVLIAAIVGHAIGFLACSSGIISGARGNRTINHDDLPSPK